MSPPVVASGGQRNLSWTTDTYKHVLMDYREIDRPKLLKRARATHTPMHTPEGENASSAGAF